MSRTRANESVSVNKQRWAAYAAAGVAATLAGTQSAEADITWVVVGPGAGDLTASAGTYFTAIGPSTTLAAAGGGGAAIFGIIGGSVAGFLAGTFPFPYASNVSFGANISTLAQLGTAAVNPLSLSQTATLAFGSGGGNDQFLNQGGYVAFQFNSGTQFGWARVSLLAGAPENSYVLEEFAYGMVGDAVTVGETGAIPEPTSLGLLALGAVGVMANRRRKKIA